MLTARFVATTYLYIGDGGWGEEGRGGTSRTGASAPQFCLSRDGIRFYSLPCL